MVQEILDYLYGLERFGIKLGLEEITKLLAVLDNPQNKFKSIHVTGTNGKGSTCAFLASILQESGCQVGLYTSPHLVRFNERIQVNRKQIKDTDLIELTKLIKQKAEENNLQPTFFEFTTALAFLYFARKKIDVAVVEVGMGGRLDATNVIVPEVSIITNIELDHTKHLGEIKSQIAQEKAGIIKAGRPLITAETDLQILSYFREECRRKNSPLFVIQELVKIKLLDSSIKKQSFVISGMISGKFVTKMLGKHQLQNASLALVAAQVLRENNHRTGLTITNLALHQGIAKTKWPGRLDLISQKPLLVIDGAHNVAGALVLKEFLQSIKEKKVLILGIAQDKDISKMVELIAPGFKTVIVTQGNFKPAPTEIIAREAKKYVRDVREITSQKKAWEAAKKLAKGKELILAAGSLYLVGDILKIVKYKSSKVKNIRV